MAAARGRTEDSQHTKPLPTDARGGEQPAPRRGGMLRRVLVRLVVGTVALAVLLVLATAFRIWQVAQQDSRKQADAIVVLGAAQYNGTPSEVLAARLDHAAELYSQGLAPTVITVGGGQRGDAYTEGRSGQLYLQRHDVPASSTVAVRTGRDTLSSLRAVKRAAESRGIGSVLVVSDPLHSLRARRMARDLGFRADASPTRSGPTGGDWRSTMHYVVRETGALLYYELTNEASDEVRAGTSGG